MTPGPDGPRVTLAKSAGGVLTFWRVTGVCMRGQCLSPAAEPGAPYCAMHAKDKPLDNDGREP